MQTGKSWKTTLFGLILAAGLWMSNNTTGKTQQIGGGIATVAAAMAGLFQKDKNVTGGDTKQE